METITLAICTRDGYREEQFTATDVELHAVDDALAKLKTESEDAGMIFVFVRHHGHEECPDEKCRGNEPSDDNFHLFVDGRELPDTSQTTSEAGSGPER
jgi:hypothetical protein